MLFDSNGNGDDGDRDPRLSRSETEILFARALSEWDKKNAAIGDTIPVGWFYELLGVMPPSAANSFERAEACRANFMLLFHGDNGFRRYVLENRKRYLKSNYAGGYEVLAPDKQTNFAQKQRRGDINKALRDELAVLSNVDMELLSSHDRKVNADAVAHNVALAKILHRRRPGFDDNSKKKK